MGAIPRCRSRREAQSCSFQSFQQEPIRPQQEPMKEGQEEKRAAVFWVL